MAHTGTNSMTKDKVIEALKLAQEALYRATLPFQIDEVKTMEALHAVDDVLDAMPLFNDWGKDWTK